MGGLIAKDLYNLKGYVKQYIFVCVFMVAMGFYMKSFSMVAVYLELLGGMMVLTSISADENVKFHKLVMTFPLSIETIVRAKYLLFLLTLSIGVILGGVSITVQELIFPEWGNFLTGISLVICPAIIFLICYAVALPYIFKNGVEKGRYIYLVVMLILAFVGFGIAKIASLFGISSDFVENNFPIGPVIACVLVACITIVFLSYRCSIRVIQRKEWE